MRLHEADDPDESLATELAEGLLSIGFHVLFIELGDRFEFLRVAKLAVSQFPPQLIIEMVGRDDSTIGVVKRISRPALSAERVHTRVIPRVECIATNAPRPPF